MHYSKLNFVSAFTMNLKYWFKHNSRRHCSNHLKLHSFFVIPISVYWLYKNQRNWWNNNRQSLSMKNKNTFHSWDNDKRYRFPWLFSSSHSLIHPAQQKFFFHNHCKNFNQYQCHMASIYFNANTQHKHIN